MKHGKQHKSPSVRGRRSRQARKIENFRVRLPEDYPWIILDRLLDDAGHVLAKEELDHVRLLIRNRDVAGVYSLGSSWGLQSIYPHETADIRKVRTKLCVGQLLKKFPFDGDPSARKQVAIQAVLNSERRCSEFNKFGWRKLLKPCGEPTEFLSLARDFVSRVLGIGYDLDPGSVTRLCRHGPGSTTSASMRFTSRYYKYGRWPYHVTPRALGHARRLIESDERWLGALESSYRERLGIQPWSILERSTFWGAVFQPVTSNKITTVPKDGRKDRPIAIEPTMNVMLQLGIDGYIRRRLKRWGIDLDNQERNQHLAYLGSVGNHGDKPCTIDLANASDTISLRIVKLLFPDNWYRYICDTRSPLGRLPNGDTLRFSKVSSMGNGATFAIESLVFASVCYACSMMTFGRYRRDLISVFGDDLTVPESMASRTVHMLEACG